MKTSSGSPPPATDVSMGRPAIRTAIARCELVLKPRAVATLRTGKLPKGDVWSTAQVAGILASKRAAELIPLCHPIPVSQVRLRQALDGRRVILEAEAATTATTGPEMHALTAVAVAALCVYDMCKVVEPGIIIRRLCVTGKTGGPGGAWTHPSFRRAPAAASARGRGRLPAGRSAGAGRGNR